MNKLYCLIILFVACRICYGQNLVPNGDFEIYGTVPCGWCLPSQFDAATSGWTSPTSGTPDIHSTLIPAACSNHQPNSTYVCNNGSQTPHSGSIFAGFYTYTENTNREYIMAQLSSPMIPGTTYYVQFYVSLGEESRWATDNMGVWFSTASVNVPINKELGYTPQILFTNVITDTANWVLLKDTITPLQPYQYIIIGNFFNDSATNIVSVNPAGCQDRAYYYCDDVCISSDSMTCNSTVGIIVNKNEKESDLFPNPFIDHLDIQINNFERLEIIFYDIASRIIIQEKFTNSISLNTSDLSKGIYIYELRNKDGVIKKGKVVKD
jgi:hypothetical protein